jgi:hypothetical protein
MSRPKAKLLNDQNAKLALLSSKFNWRTYSQWCDALSINSESTVAAWMGGNGISDPFKYTIVNFLNKKQCTITIDELIHISYNDFGIRLGLAQEMVNLLARGKSGITQENDSDVGDPVASMAGTGVDITGRYIGAYRSHLKNDIFAHAIAIEQFEILRGPDANTLLLRQCKNYVTKTAAVGPLVIASERILGQTSYENGNYPNSIYYMMPVCMFDDNKIFCGIYTDITGDSLREIFSTKFILFSWDCDGTIPDRSPQGDEFYRLILPLVQNELSKRARLVVEPPTYELRSEILDSVRSARLALERLTL